MVTTVIQAGKYRHRITIQKPVEDPDNNGEPKWVNVLINIRAAIEPLNGREFFAASQVQNDVTTKIAFRYRDGITGDMRILHKKQGCDAEIYNIESVMPDATFNKEIVCWCRVRLAKGFRTNG